MNRFTSKKMIQKVAAAAFWLIIWQIAAEIVDSALIFPSFTETFYNMGVVMTTPGFLRALGLTMLRVFGGVFCAFTLGSIIGMAAGLFRPLNDLLAPLLTTVRCIPVVSIILLLNLWFNSSIAPVTVTFLVCFPLAYTNIEEGMRNTDPLLLEMAQVYNVGFFKTVKEIYWPSLRPYIITALMNTIGMGWKATVTAEVLANTRPSVGINLYYSKLYLETETLFAWTAIIIICSWLIEILTKSKLKKWSTSHD